MNDYSVKDLALAGVAWEITDVPSALRAKWAAAQTAPTTQTNTQTPNQNNPNTGPSVVPPIAPVSTVTVETVESMASRPTDIDNLIRMIGDFNHPLRSAATRVVFPNIAKNPNGLVILTDIPGAEDDATGNILSGGAGDLLDKMLAAIGMSRDSVSIVPVVFWRTPGGRTPSENEISLVRPFTLRLIEFLKPRVILTLGQTAAQFIADIKLAGNHGKVCETKSGIPVMPIYHPNYLLLKPSAKREVWDALQQLQNMLKIQ